MTVFILKCAMFRHIIRATVLLPVLLVINADAEQWTEKEMEAG